MKKINKEIEVVQQKLKQLNIKGQTKKTNIKLLIKKKSKKYLQLEAHGTFDKQGNPMHIVDWVVATIKGRYNLSEYNII